MLFLWSIGSKNQSILSQVGVCKNCESMAHIEVFYTYHYFSLFFIPLFKWGKKYYAQCSRCGAIYNLPNELGKDIKKGVVSSVSDNDIEYVKGSSIKENNYCTYCGAARKESDDNYCPKCGHKYKG